MERKTVAVKAGLEEDSALSESLASSSQDENRSLGAGGGVLTGFLSHFNDPFVLLPTVTNLNVGERNLDESLC